MYNLLLHEIKIKRIASPGIKLEYKTSAKGRVSAIQTSELLGFSVPLPRVTLTQNSYRIKTTPFQSCNPYATPFSLLNITASPSDAFAGNFAFLGLSCAPA